MKETENSFGMSEKNTSFSNFAETNSANPKILRINRKIFGKLVDKVINKFVLRKEHAGKAYW